MEEELPSMTRLPLVSTVFQAWPLNVHSDLEIRQGQTAALRSMV
jgi:hypothetical protein